MHISLSMAPHSRRVLGITIASVILALTNPHIPKYSRFSLLLISKVRCHCAATASVLGIPSPEYTIGVKERLRSRQDWRYFSFSPYLLLPEPSQIYGAGMSPHLN